MVQKRKTRLLLLILVPLILALVIGAIILLSKKRREREQQKQRVPDNQNQVRDGKDKSPRPPSDGEGDNKDKPNDPVVPPPTQPSVPPDPLPPVKPLEGLKDGYGQIGLIKSLDSLLMSGVIQDVTSIDKVMLPSKDEKRVVPKSLTTIGRTDNLFSRALDAKVYPEIILASLNKTFVDREDVLSNKNLGSDIVARPIDKNVLDSIGELIAKPLRAEQQLEICSMIFTQGKENVIQGLYRLGLHSFSLDRVWLDFMRVFENRLASNGMINLHPQQYLDRLPFTKSLLTQLIDGFDGDLAKWRGRETLSGDPYAYESYMLSGGSDRNRKQAVDQIRTDDLRELHEAFNRKIHEITAPLITKDAEKGFMTGYWKVDSFKVHVPLSIVKEGEVYDHLFLRYCFICGCNSASSVNEQALKVASTVLTGRPQLEANARVAFNSLLSANFSVADAHYPIYNRIPSGVMTNWSYEIIHGKPHAYNTSEQLFYQPKRWEDLLSIQRVSYIPRKSNVNAEVNDAILLGFLTDRKIAGRVLAGHALSSDKRLFNDFFDRLDFGVVNRNLPIRMAGSHSFDTRFGIIVIHGFKVEDESLPITDPVVAKGGAETLQAFLTIAQQQAVPRLSVRYEGTSLSEDKPSTLGDLFFLGGYMIRKASLNEDLEYIYDQVSHSAIDNLSVDERLLLTNSGFSCIYRVLCKSAKEVLGTLDQQEKDYFSSINADVSQATALTVESLKTNGEDPENRIFSIIDDTLRSQGETAKALRGDSDWWETQFPSANRFVISLIKFV